MFNQLLKSAPNFSFRNRLIIQHLHFTFILYPIAKLRLTADQRLERYKDEPGSLLLEPGTPEDVDEGVDPGPQEIEHVSEVHEVELHPVLHLEVVGYDQHKLNQEGHPAQHKRDQDYEDGPGGVYLTVSFGPHILGLEGRGDLHLMAEVEVGVEGPEDFRIIVTHRGEGDYEVTHCVYYHLKIGDR